MKKAHEIDTHILLLKSEIDSDAWFDYCMAFALDPETTQVIKVITHKHIPYSSLEEYERDI